MDYPITLSNGKHCVTRGAVNSVDNDRNNVGVFFLIRAALLATECHMKLALRCSTRRPGVEACAKRVFPVNLEP